MEHLFWCNEDQHLTKKKRAAAEAVCDLCGKKVPTIGYIEHKEQEETSEKSE